MKHNKGNSRSNADPALSMHQGEQLRQYLDQLAQLTIDNDLPKGIYSVTLNDILSASITYVKQEYVVQDSANNEKSALNDTLLSLSLPIEESSVTSAQFGLKPAISSLNLGQINPHTEESLRDLSIASDFHIEKILGEGGMGRVYSGQQTCLKREVALKVSKVDSSEPRLIAQVFHEAQITANLDHPNILPIYLLALDKHQQPVQVMKQINGVTWAELLSDPQHKHWTQLESPEGQTHFHLQVLAQVCQAMSYAHDHQVIHRDLKPENVMIGSFGEVYVLDWGVALYLPAIGVAESETDYIAQVKSALDEALVGTPLYMSPEMARCDVSRLGPWSDVYLLGAILYEILFKRRIRVEQEVKQLFRQIMRGDLPELSTSISEEFKSLITSSLAMNTDDRIPNAHSFRKLLLHAIRTQKATAVYRKAHQLQLSLHAELQRPEGARVDASALYDRARLTYRTSLEMWSESERARADLDRLHVLWGQYLISQRDLEGAKRAISRLHLPHPDLTQQLEDGFSEQSRVERERAVLQEWHEGELMSHSRPLRLIFAIIGLIIFGFGTLLLDYLQRHGHLFIDAKSEFFAAVGFSLLVYFSFMVSAFKRRQTSNEANAIFQRLVSHLFVITIAVSLHRFISWQSGLTFQSLLHLEMTLIALGCFGLSSISGKKDFLWGGLSYGLMGLISISSPELITTLYALAMVALWLGVLISWWVDKGDSAPILSDSRDIY